MNDSTSHDARNFKTCWDAIILGAGVSGLVCAAEAAKHGLSTLIIDHNDSPGRKLRITGGGKCNLTNLCLDMHDYVGENSAFCRSALARFSPVQLLEMLSEAGIAVEEREHGQIFCKRSAKDLLNMLVKSCHDHGCCFALSEKVLRVRRIPSGNSGTFSVDTPKNSYVGRSVVIATGGPAWPSVGASGIGYALAKALGHRVVPIRPALVGIVMPENWPLTGLAGISTDVAIDVLPAEPDNEQQAPTRKRRNSRPGPQKAAGHLPVLFTHRGLSGPAALQASLFFHPGCALRIDFLPGHTLTPMLLSPENGKLLVRGLMKRLLPDRLAELLVAEYADLKVAELSKSQRDMLHSMVHEVTVTPEGTEDFTSAEVTAGGVAVDGVSSRTMQSKHVWGLFFCGEVLDITGRLGGYNLHWAFASGYAAGLGLAEAHHEP